MAGFSPTAIPNERMHKLGQRGLALLKEAGVAMPAEGVFCAGVPVVEYRDLTKPDTEEIDLAAFAGRITLGAGVLTSGRSPFPADAAHLSLVRWGLQPDQCGKITVGVNTTLSAGGIVSYVGVTIGDDVLFGPNVVMIDALPSREDPDASADAPENLYMAPIVIEDRAWIGAQAILLPGVTIGHHATVATMSVVTQDVPPHSLAVGNPARVVSQFQ
jgi:acetyltransferase-like isoleucine patch superfamily enzyme